MPDLHDRLDQYLNGDLAFADLWSYACNDPRVLLGMELLEFYDMWSKQMLKGRELPDEFEINLRERLVPLNKRSW